MKKTLAFLLALSMLFALAACGYAAESKSTAPAAESTTASEPTSEPAAEAGAAADSAALSSDSSTDTYKAFLQNEVNVTVDAQLEELSQGDTYTLAGLEEAFLAGLKNTMGLGDNASCTRVQAALIDCGSDGNPELALRLTVDTQMSGDLLEDFVIRCGEDGLHLVAGFTTYYRTYSELYTNGLVLTGGSNSAFSSCEIQYYIPGDGLSVFLVYTETYPCLDKAVVPQEQVPSSEWDNYPATDMSGSGNITLTVYNFTNDQSDYDTYMRNNLFVFTDESGNDVAVDADTAQLNASLGLQVISSSDAAGRLQQVYASVGLAQGAGDPTLQPVQWQDPAALLG